MSGIEACFTGRLGRDAEFKLVRNGELPMVSFSAVVDQQHQTDDQPACWVRVVTFGDQAEELTPRLLKGVRVYCEGRLEASIWTPDNAGAPRLNLNLTATTIQPLGQIGRRRPRQAHAQRGQRAHDRARQAGEALLAASGRETSRRRENQEPPQGWLDDTDAAVEALTYGGGR